MTPSCLLMMASGNQAVAFCFPAWLYQPENPSPASRIEGYNQRAILLRKEARRNRLLKTLFAHKAGYGYWRPVTVSRHSRNRSLSVLPVNRHPSLLSFDDSIWPAFKSITR